MLVESLCPLRVASITWQTGIHAYALTVVCKATFDLCPGVARLANEQEYPNDDENHWNDDPARSVYSPSDLVPVKRRADVVLVGHAFAPRGAPVHRLFARLRVGAIDKAIEARSEGAAFVKMPLRYERAPGGTGTGNPVGVVGGAPNLAQPGREATAPIGFGPIAATWPSRADKLGPGGAAWLKRRWHEAPMPPDLDPAFFNSAPEDQRLDRIEPSQRITLENLSPDHPRLSTTLPGVRPRAFVRRPHGGIEELELTADTLWIDTDRSLGTVTWRGRYPLVEAHEEGRIVVLMEKPGAPVDLSAMQLALESSGGQGETPQDGFTQELRLADRASATRARPLPFSAPPQTAADAPERRGGGPRLDDKDEAGNTMTELPEDPAHDASPSWLAGARGSPPDLAVAPPPTPPSARPPPALGWAPSPSVEPARAELAWNDAAPQRAPPAPPPSVGGSTAPPDGVLGSSNAAASPSAWMLEPPLVRAEPAPSAPAAKAPSRPAAGDLVELLWFEPAALPRIREAPLFREPIASQEPTPPAIAYDDDPVVEESQEAKDRRALFGALTRVAPLGPAELDAALEDAVGELGAFEPPLALVAGELAFPFDELAALKATIGAAAPLAAGDKKLKEAIELATELVKSPLSPDAAESVLARIKEAFAQPGRMLPATYLDTHTDRLLLEQRQYQRRALLGQRYLRTLFTPAGATLAIPTYLPDSLAGSLPLFLRLRARLVVEVHLSQDQYETHSLALRVVVLARVAAIPGARR